MDIVKRIQAHFIERKITLAFAESCTGGRMASLITEAPGASQYFLGSIVCYADEIKRDLLGVPQDLLNKKGAVSEEVVGEMLKGLFRITSADRGVAVSGVAGPTGGSEEKPVGTICAALGARNQKSLILTFQALGSSRAEIMMSTCNYLFERLLQINN